MDTDALLHRARSGDVRAREQLFTQYRDRLKQMIHLRMDPRLAPRLDCSDVVQETMAEASQRLDEYLRCQPLPFYPWLRQIAWDKLIELHRFHFRRKRSVEREQPIDMRLGDQSACQLAESLAVGHSSPSGRLVRSELAGRIRMVLDRLPSADQEILTLRHLEQLTTNETAAVLGISESAAKSRHFRAMERLLRHLDESDLRRLP